MSRNGELHKGQNILEKEIAVVTDWILGKYSMNKLPKDRTLKTLLDGYTKEKMMALSDENGFEARRKWKKTELVDYLADCILKNLEERLLLLGKKILQLLQGNVGNGFSRDSNEFFAFYIQAFPAATRMGLLFSIEDDDEIVSYMPDEVIEKLSEVIANYSSLEKKHAEGVRFWKELDGVMHAGIALYGIISKGTIYDLWEIYKPMTKKIDAEEYVSRMRSISHYIPLIAMRNNFYIIEGFFIGSDMLASEEEVERFYENLPARTELDNYKPTKADLNQYIKYSFDRRSTSYKKMKQFVSKQDLNMPFQNIMSYIETNIQLGKKLTDLIIDFKRMDLLQFRTFKDFKKFSSYYIDLHNHSRIWHFRGHTPAEVGKTVDPTIGF